MHDDPETAIDPNAWRGRMRSDQIRRARAGYYGSITFIDSQIGRLLNWMARERPTMLATTWFLFTSDHGDMQGDHHLWRNDLVRELAERDCGWVKDGKLSCPGNAPLVSPFNKTRWTGTKPSAATRLSPTQTLRQSEA